MILYYYPKCSTCMKAKRFLEEQGHLPELVDLMKETPSAEELKSLHQKSGLDLKRFFNTSGQLYRSMAIKDRYDSMTDEERYELLASDGYLIKRPILLKGDRVYVGFREKEWEQ